MPPRVAKEMFSDALVESRGRLPEAWAEEITQERRHPSLLLETFLEDIRYGWRLIRRNPVFSAVVVLTLTVGSGVNVGVFTVVNALALRPHVPAIAGRPADPPPPHAGHRESAAGRRGLARHARPRPPRRQIRPSGFPALRIVRPRRPRMEPQRSAAVPGAHPQMMLSTDLPSRRPSRPPAGAASR